MLPAPTWLLQLGIALVFLVIFLWKFSVRKFDYWKKRGIHYVEPTPIVGNLWDVVSGKNNLADWLSDLYKSTDEKFFGIFIFDDPVLVVKDPKIVQLVMIKDSDNFVNRSIADPHDEVIKNNLFFQKDSAWKTDRTKLTPVFTAAKMKGMFYLINNIGKEMVGYFNKHLGEIDAKDISTRYTTNVIAKCAFGIDAYCFDETDSDFRKYGKRMFNFTWRNAFSQMSYFLKPNLVRIFHLDLFERIVRDYFVKVFMESMASRGTTNNKTKDFLDLLIDLKNSGQFSEATVCGQAILFFTAGSDTTSTAIAFTLHELCLNKEIQNKVRAEIHETIKNHGSLTYEAVQEMKYLKSCISETLRKYPISFLGRVCKTEYTVPGTDLVIEKGMSVYIPLLALHKDEKYFPEPEKFIPDRFMEKNCNQNGLVYIPFGEGPRKCIGDRFGLMSTQIGLIHILSNFAVERCAETPDPVVLEPKSFTTQSKVGLPMRLKRITSTRDS